MMSTPQTIHSRPAWHCTGSLSQAVRGVVAVVVTLLAVVALLVPALGRAQADPTFPPLTGRIVDAANLLSDDVEARLDAALGAHETETSNQVVVVTVPDLEGYDIADYALRLGRAWGIGTADKNNGVVLLVAPTERKVRIEVGYGLEGALTDALSGQIIRRELLPAFRENDYPGGIEKGVAAILAAIKGEYVAEPAGSSQKDKPGAGLLPLVLFGAFGIQAALSRGGLHRPAAALIPASFAGAFGYIIGGNPLIGLGAAIAVFLLILLLSKGGGTGSGGGPSSRPHRGGYVGGGGFGGGGGFSGGGGSFGGGGASGGW